MDNYLLLLELVLYCHMNKNLNLVLIALAVGYQTASAQLVTESFGSGDNAFSMDFVTIDNPGNEGSPPATGIHGSVAYIYNLSKNEVSREMITKANTAGSLGIGMYDMSIYGGNGLLKPATGISWYEAARYVNWLNTSKNYQAAYKFDGSGTFQLWSSTDAGYNANNMFRNSLAKYVIASEDEWYKGGYGNPNGGWSKYPNGSDSAPTPVPSGTDANTAVYGQSQFNGPADINNAGGLSVYGTMGQGGNALEWMETAYDGTNDSAGENRVLRGGNWNSSTWYNAADLTSGFTTIPAAESYNLGFRVVMVPEPSALSLFAVGLGGFAMIRRRRK